jgi:hypothetical protein
MPAWRKELGLRMLLRLEWPHAPLIAMMKLIDCCLRTPKRVAFRAALIVTVRRVVSTEALAGVMTFLGDSKLMAPCFGSLGEQQEEQLKLFPSPLRLVGRGAAVLSQRT